MADGEGRLVAGRYRLHRELGRGGMGTVWHATDEHLDRDVAVKEIQLNGRQLLPADPEVRRALREGRAAAKVGDHPGIVTVHDVVTDDHGLPWIVMELLKGRSLSAALAAYGPTPINWAAWIGTQVLAALDYAHSRNVLHRDVKPGNVMLTHSRVVLTDFGIATINGASVLTETGQLAGAPEYIAPERVEGKEAQPATDLWSVGVMLYAMVVGRTPFRRDSVRATTNAALTQDPNPDEKIGPLWPVIQGLLRKRPAERMTARRAIDLLNMLSVESPTSFGAGGTGHLDPAPSGDSDSANTVTQTTIRLTPSSSTLHPSGPQPPTRPPARPTAPPFPPSRRDFGPGSPNPPWVAPDAPTLDPPGPPRRRRIALVAGAAFLVMVAIVTAVVMTNVPGDGQDPAPPTTATPTAGTSPSPELVPHSDRLGFDIKVPRGWPERRPSGSDQVALVTWQGDAPNSGLSALLVRVRREDAPAGVDLVRYLKGPVANSTDYDEESANDDASSATLEYTYREGPRHYHVWEQVRLSGQLYTLSFLLDASDEGALQDRWEALEPTIVEIRDSFELV